MKPPSEFFNFPFCGHDCCAVSNVPCFTGFLKTLSLFVFPLLERLQRNGDDPVDVFRHGVGFKGPRPTFNVPRRHRRQSG